MRRQQLFGFMAAAVLSVLLCLPAAAQSGTTASSPQATMAVNSTQASAQPSVPSGASTPAAANAPLQPPVRQGFWGRMNPFARKKYVEGQLAPIRDRVNELDGLTDDNTKAIADVDSRAKAGIAAAGDTAKQANDTAAAAQQQVQQDATQANQLNDQVGATNAKLQAVDQYQAAQTAELHFQPGPAKLSPDAQQQLDGFLQGLDTQKGYVVEVTAYSTRKGPAGVTASQQLADTVVRYMVLQHNVPLYRIYTMGMGDATPSAASNAAPVAAQMDQSASAGRTKSTIGGTVEIKILKNSLASDASPAS